MAADFTGDGLADDWSGPLEYCADCRPFAASDLDADGDQELAVLEQASSTPQYVFFSAVATDAGPHLRPLKVAPPGAPRGGLKPGSPLSITLGTDEGFSGWLACDGYPTDPVLVWTWSNFAIEQDTTKDVSEIRLRLGDDGTFHVLGDSRYTIPVDKRVAGVSTGPACGMDLDPAE